MDLKAFWKVMDLKAFWKVMEDTGAGVCTIFLDAHGVERSRAIILVHGVKEVREITDAVRTVEQSW